MQPLTQPRGRGRNRGEGTGITSPVRPLPMIHSSANLSPDTLSNLPQDICTSGATCPSNPAGLQADSTPPSTPASPCPPSSLATPPAWSPLIPFPLPFLDSPSASPTPVPSHSSYLSPGFHLLQPREPQRSPKPVPVPSYNRDAQAIHSCPVCRYNT